MNIRKSVLLLAAALCARAAFALTSWDASEATDMTYLDGGKDNESNNFANVAADKLLINKSEEAGETHVLFRAPPELFDADVARLAKATATFNVTRARNWDDRAIELLPLASAYDTASTTWLDRETGTAWTTEGGGGDVLEGSVFPGVYDAEKQTVTFDLLPLLADADAATAFQANGALVRLNSDERPEASFVMLQLATPANEGESLHPQIFWVELDPYADVRDFAVSYTDSRDADTVYWEQALATVGKVILNGEDGSECRAIVSMSESLAAIPPSLVQSVVAKFDAEIRDWEGEDIFLAPLTTPTKLERFPNNEDSPVYGPSWNCADASVDTNATSYVIGDETFDNASWETAGGDWMADAVIRGTVTAPVKGTTGTAEFDLTPLWHDDAARTALLANGAIVFLDPAEFPQVKEDQRMARVNLYRPDEIVELTKHAFSWMRITEYEALADASSATPVTAFRIDSASPDASYFGQNSAKLVMNYRDGSETRAFFQLPIDELDEDLPALDSYSVRFNGGCKDNGDQIPVLLSPVATDFGTTDEIRTTWNSAWTNTATGDAEAWATAGGDWSDFSVVGTYDKASGNLDFDLATLQRDPEAAELALRKGLIMRFDPDQTVVDPEEKGMPRITIGAAGQIIKTPKTVATTYIDSASPNANFAAAKKTLVTLNKASAGTEARALVKFSPAILDVDLNSAGSVNLLISYFRCWQGDDGVNPVALHPAATAFRLGEATWNNATADTAWENPGGDFLDAHVTASDSPAQSMLAFDLAPLLANAEAAAALAANGAVVRMLGDAPEASNNNGYNVNGSVSASVPAIVLAPAELHVRALGSDPETGALHFSVAGLDPTRTYVLESTPVLVNPVWTVEQVFPLTGELTVVPPEGAAAAYYRIIEAD